MCAPQTRFLQCLSFKRCNQRLRACQLASRQWTVGCDCCLGTREDTRLVFEDVTGPAAGLCFHIRPKHADLSAVHQGPPLAWVAYRHLHLPWKGSTDICFWQTAGLSTATDPPVNWAENNLHPPVCPLSWRVRKRSWIFYLIYAWFL